ncbi:MAG TPA: trypsin-like peptidase domain-containing protein [Candidatus Saccharimonadales bacterium]|nr:trypsin-like peptidase domain-containing protein [Candidatus Saccharimonadales bacterium]
MVKERSKTDEATDINQVENQSVDDKATVDSQTKTDRPKHSHPTWFYGGLIFFCFVASFLGAWAFLTSGLIDISKTITSNQQTVVSQEGDLIAKVAKDVSPSVVSIITESVNNSGFFPTEETAAGTGMIISEDGYVLTNRHVIGDRTSSVTIVLADGTVKRNVKVIGRDPLNDLAFLKIDDVDDLKPVSLGDSSTLSVGEKVIAIGNALGQYQTTVTSGIISGLGRPIVAGDRGLGGIEQLSNLLQTDAAINPGNSGGPLLTLSGKVIGINTAVAEGAEGIGFAIPINQAKGLIQSVLKTGQVVRAYLGVRYVSVTPVAKDRYDLGVDDGAYIVAGSRSEPGVLPGSPADKAGLKEKDVITAINGQAIDARHPLSDLISQYTVGDTIDVAYSRSGQTHSTKVTLERYSS